MPKCTSIVLPDIFSLEKELRHWDAKFLHTSSRGVSSVASHKPRPWRAGQILSTTVYNWLYHAKVDKVECSVSACFLNQSSISATYCILTICWTGVTPVTLILLHYYYNLSSLFRHLFISSWAHISMWNRECMMMMMHAAVSFHITSLGICAVVDLCGHLKPPLLF